MADTDFWNKEFVITSITRDDLVTQGFDRNVVELLSEDDLRQIASAMEDIYCDHGFWEDLELCTNRTLKRNAEDFVLEQDIQDRQQQPKED